jgi:hypothetical protein
MGTAYADDIIQKLQEFQRSAHVLLDNVYVLKERLLLDLN